MTKYHSQKSQPLSFPQDNLRELTEPDSGSSTPRASNREYSASQESEAPNDDYESPNNNILPTHPKIYYAHDGALFDENDTHRITPGSDLPSLATEDFEGDPDSNAGIDDDDLDPHPDTGDSNSQHNSQQDEYQYFDDDSDAPRYRKKTKAPKSVKELHDPDPSSLQYRMGFRRGVDHDAYVKRRKEGRRVITPTSPFSCFKTLYLHTKILSLIITIINRSVQTLPGLLHGHLMTATSAESNWISCRQFGNLNMVIIVTL